LAEINGVDVFTLGLSGNTLLTDANASSGSAAAFYSSGLARALTIKESFNVILTELAALSRTISAQTTTDVDADILALQSSQGLQGLNLTQLALDAGGPNYTLDDDGAADLTYPLAQHIQNIGAMFTGFPGTGLAGFTNTYPALTFPVALSDVTLDTTVPMGTITGLTTALGKIRDFTGMDSISDGNPNYSAHGTITYVSNGQTLEGAIQTLDEAVTGLADTGNITSVLTLTGSAAAGVGTMKLTTDGLAPGVGNVITLGAHKVATLYIQWVFGGYVAASPITGSGIIVAQIYREGGANTLKMQVMDVEGSASDVDVNFVTIGAGGGGGATAGLDYDIVESAPGVYVELATGITTWDGTWRGSAVVRMVQVALA
jgi:hypothetical protein